MKAIIPCAGEGIRMRPLTLDTPKPLLVVAGRPILEHILDSLPDEIDEAVLVVGYLGDKLRAHFGGGFNGRKIRYAVQKEKKGTWDALMQARPFLDNDRFLLLYGDDIIDKKSIGKCLDQELCVLVKEVEDPRRFGVAVVDGSNKVRLLVEKPVEPPSRLALVGVQVLDGRVFDYPPPRHESGEFYLTDSLARVVKEHDVFAEHAERWLSAATPDDLKKMEEELMKIA